jgi:hypothetical protein
VPGQAAAEAAAQPSEAQVEEEAAVALPSEAQVEEEAAVPLPSEAQVEEAAAAARPSEVQVEAAAAVALPSEAQVEQAAEHPPEPQSPGRQADPTRQADAGPADPRHHEGDRRGPLPDRRRDLLLDYRRVLHRGAVDPLSSAPAEAVMRPAGLSLVDPSPFHPVVLA